MITIGRGLVNRIHNKHRNIACSLEPFLKLIKAISDSHVESLFSVRKSTGASDVSKVLGVIPPWFLFREVNLQFLHEKTFCCD